MTGPEHPALAWARSGAMALTGYADGPPLLAPGDPAGTVGRALERVSHHGGRNLPGVEVLSERAALTGGTRTAPGSVGGAYRPLRTRDGWLGLSLSRPSDFDLLPALIEHEVGTDPWSAVLAWAARTPTTDAVARTTLLGLPASAIPAAPVGPARPGVIVTGRRKRVVRSDRVRVIDLTALWAGPLCANLLTLAGAEVVTVESRTRPDGARAGTPQFYELLHHGREPHVLNFADPERLRRLLATADVVLESARPRALSQLGIDCRGHVAAGAIWLSITAYGRANPMRIGFGDDVAAGAGLVAWRDGVPCPVGDAIADPITGVCAAAAVLDALAAEQACLIDVSMHDLCAEAAIAEPASPAALVYTTDGWTVRAADHAEPVASPHRRSTMSMSTASATNFPTRRRDVERPR